MVGAVFIFISIFIGTFTIPLIARCRDLPKICRDVSPTGEFELVRTIWRYDSAYFLCLFSLFLLFIGLANLIWSNYIIAIIIALFSISLVYFFVNDEDLTFLTEQTFSLERNGESLLYFTWRGGSWEFRKRILWDPDGKGFLIVHYRDITNPVNHFPIPKKTPEWNGSIFTYRVTWKGKPSVPAFPGTNGVDYSTNASYLKSYWKQYGFDPNNPDCCDRQAPLAERWADARAFFAYTTWDAWKVQRESAREILDSAPSGPS